MLEKERKSWKDTIIPMQLCVASINKQLKNSGLGGVCVARIRSRGV